MPEPGRWWIVGASEGLLGRAIARALDAEGAELILSARSEGRLRDLAQELHAARAVPMDVTDGASVARAAAEAAEAGEVDGVIYAAGAYEPIGVALHPGAVATGLSRPRVGPILNCAPRSSVALGMDRNFPARSTRRPRDDDDFP